MSLWLIRVISGSPGSSIWVSLRLPVCDSDWLLCWTVWPYCRDLAAAVWFSSWNYECHGQLDATVTTSHSASVVQVATDSSQARTETVTPLALVLLRPVLVLPRAWLGRSRRAGPADVVQLGLKYSWPGSYSGWRSGRLGGSTAAGPVEVLPARRRRCSGPGQCATGGPTGRGIGIFKLRLHIFKSKPCHRSTNIAMFIDFDEILLLLLPLICNFNVIILN